MTTRRSAGATMRDAKTTAAALIDITRAVTKTWARQRKAEERHQAARANRFYRMTRVREDTIKDVAYAVMEQAYLKASANGTLPAHARQIMYQARPLIQAKTEKPLNDQYFCQQLLPNYVHEKNVAWNVVYDDRGHFTEPHTGEVIGLGTLNVRQYLSGMHQPELVEPKLKRAAVSTSGPTGSFGAVLFVEKEGFAPLFEAVRLAERYDIAIMSTKGMSVTAARALVDSICGAHGVPLLVLHDFDKSGFSILGTLQRATRRFSFRHHHRVIDLGLRLADVEELGLESETAFDRGDNHTKRANLRANGATQREIEFLLEDRVELNALASDELIEWLERKLDHHGIRKIIPDKQTLADTYRLFVRSKRVEKIITEALEKEDDAKIGVPADLKKKVSEHLVENPEVRWDAAVREIVDEADKPATKKKASGKAGDPPTEQT
jgi:hypothetical protein